MNQLTNYNSYPFDSYIFSEALYRHGTSIQKIVQDPRFRYSCTTIYRAFQLKKIRKDILDNISEISGISVNELVNPTAASEYMPSERVKQIEDFLKSLNDREKYYILSKLSM